MSHMSGVKCFCGSPKYKRSWKAVSPIKLVVVNYLLYKDHHSSRDFGTPTEEKEELNRLRSIINVCLDNIYVT